MLRFSRIFKSNASHNAKRSSRTEKLIAKHARFEQLENRLMMAAGITPDDARFHQQWALDVTQAEPAWAISTGSTNVTTAVIDTGVDYTHPDLYKNIWINQLEIPPVIAASLHDTDADGLLTIRDLNQPINTATGLVLDHNGTGYIDAGDLLLDSRWANGVDESGNGLVDDLIGWDFVDNDNDPMDVKIHVTPGNRSRFGHGTFISGVIGAEGNNGIGVAGINWQTQIMSLRFTPAFSGGTLAEFETSVQAATAAVEYATANGARVSNLSAAAPAAMVNPGLSQGILEAFQEAALHDHLIVGISGNESTDIDQSPRFPWDFGLDNVIVVAATAAPLGNPMQDSLASFSNYGYESVDLGAPGDGIWGISPIDGPNSGYDQRSGTSHAAPHVAGAAALILSINPNLSAVDVKSLIHESVDLLPSLDGKTITGGRLNLLNSANAATSTIAMVNQPLAECSGNGGTPTSVTSDSYDVIQSDMLSRDSSPLSPELSSEAVDALLSRQSDDLVDTNLNEDDNYDTYSSVSDSFIGIDLERP